MALVLVTYDLSNSGRQDYAGLHEALRLTPWWHWLESTWILSTAESPDQVYNRLAQHLDAKDWMLVVRVDGTQRQGWLPKKAWDWIRANDHP